MNLTTKLSDARGVLRDAGWSDEDVLAVIPLEQSVLQISSDSSTRLKGEGVARSIIIELVAAMRRYEMNVDELPPFEHQQMIRRAEAFLSESSENTAEGEGEVVKAFSEAVWHICIDDRYHCYVCGGLQPSHKHGCKIPSLIASITSGEGEAPSGGDAESVEAATPSMQATLDALWGLAHSMFFYENDDNDGPTIDYNRDNFKSGARKILARRKPPTRRSVSPNVAGASSSVLHERLFL